MVSQFFVEEYRGMDIDRLVLDAGDPRGYQLFCWFPLNDPWSGCKGTTDVTCNNGGPGYATVTEVKAAIDNILDCVPHWQCELPLNGYENDGCGNSRLNSNCNPPNQHVHLV